jgi:hypothetical protein
MLIVLLQYDDKLISAALIPLLILYHRLTTKRYEGKVYPKAQGILRQAETFWPPKFLLNTPYTLCLTED